MKVINATGRSSVSGRIVKDHILIQVSDSVKKTYLW